MSKKVPCITAASIKKYAAYLQENERSAATVESYTRALRELLKFMGESPLTKAALVAWKQQLVGQYAPATVNAMLAAVNGFVKFMGWPMLAVKPLRIQRALFLEERKELTRAEYERLVQTARQQGREQLALVLQTICATGIRVSELQFITAEAVYCGRAEVSNKGKRRLVFLPQRLREVLKGYLRKQKKTAGAVFTTRTGKPLDRSNIWRAMKALCESAGVAAEKVYPHNLRHLFARVFYALEKDLSRLADILGHSNLTTTRIYTAESGTIHAKQMGRLGLVIT